MILLIMIFVNHIRLPGVSQFLARSIERPADGANCRSIENTYGNEPKNRQQVHAPPACTRRAPCCWRNRTEIRRSQIAEHLKLVLSALSTIGAFIEEPRAT
jgi:hypothetical protein